MSLQEGTLASVLSLSYSLPPTHFRVLYVATGKGESRQKGILSTELKASPCQLVSGYPPVCQAVCTALYCAWGPLCPSLSVHRMSLALFFPTVSPFLARDLLCAQ